MTTAKRATLPPTDVLTSPDLMKSVLSFASADSEGVYGRSINKLFASVGSKSTGYGSMFSSVQRLQWAFDTDLSLSSFGFTEEEKSELRQALAAADLAVIKCALDHDYCKEDGGELVSAAVAGKRSASDLDMMLGWGCDIDFDDVFDQVCADSNLQLLPWVMKQSREAGCAGDSDYLTRVIQTGSVSMVRVASQVLQFCPYTHLDDCMGDANGLQMTSFLHERFESLCRKQTWQLFMNAAERDLPEFMSFYHSKGVPARILQEVLQTAREEEAEVVLQWFAQRE